MLGSSPNLELLFYILNNISMKDRFGIFAGANTTKN